MSAEKSNVLIVNQQGRLMISGDLNFFTTIALWNQSLTLFTSLNELNLDLSGVHSSNSAGLALIIEWIKYAKNMKKIIRFFHLPQQLQSIISAAGMTKEVDAYSS